MEDATRNERVIRLPNQLLHVIARHHLGGVEAMLLLHLILRWPSDSFGEGMLLRLDAARAGRAMGVSTPAAYAAVERLRLRRLVGTEVHRGRQRIRLGPIDREVGGLWPGANELGAVELPEAAVEATIATASRGRDAVLLLALLMAGADTDGRVRITNAALANRLQLDRRSVQRIVRRVVDRGLVRWTRNGFDVSGLLEMGRKRDADPTNGHPARRGESDG